MQVTLTFYAPDQQRAQLAEASRKLTLLRVNEDALVRRFRCPFRPCKCFVSVFDLCFFFCFSFFLSFLSSFFLIVSDDSLAKNAEEVLHKENRRLKNDLVRAEKAVHERLGYLERYKEASSYRIAALQQALQNTVSRSDLDNANRHVSICFRSFSHRGGGGGWGGGGNKRKGHKHVHVILTAFLIFIYIFLRFLFSGAARRLPRSTAMPWSG